jgi:hypothetical protein
MCFPFRFGLAIALLALCGCAGTKTYVYRYIPGKTATLREGYAVPPQGAPPEVLAAVAAGNRIAGFPYRRGGGHGCSDDSAYDCSGAVSYVLRGAGRLKGALTSGGFRGYGREGEGDWISIYARKGHVFVVVAGLRFDTGWNGAEEGPRWTTRSRKSRACVIRHPPGL